MPSLDWEVLRHETRTIADIVAGDCLSSPHSTPFAWYRAELTIDGQPLGPVEVRKKGFLGSLSTTKPSLRVALNRPQSGLAFEGDDRLVFNNMRQDPSLINTCLAYGFLADAGLPAPRCAFARVSLNGQDLGIYAQVEAIDDPLLRRHFRSDSGNLYEATLSDFRPEFRGTWGKKNNKTRDDWTDLDRAVTRLAGPDETLLAEAAKSFDLLSFYRHWASEVLLGHWDGYAGNLNNTWLYEDPATQTFHFLPWGMDAVFGPDPNSDLSPPSAGGLYASGHLARRLYGLPEGRLGFRDALRALLESWDEDALIARIDAFQALLLPRLPGTEVSSFRATLNSRRAWIRGRRAALGQLVADAPPVWQPPQRESICWVQVGTVSATFDTTWGTSGWNLLGARATMEANIDGIAITPGNLSANARAVTDDNVDNRGLVEVLGRGEGTLIHVVSVNFPMMSMVPEVEIPIDWVSAEGYIGLFDTETQSFELQGFLLTGTLTFEDAFALPGEPIRGRIDAPVLRAP